MAAPDEVTTAPAPESAPLEPTGGWASPHKRRSLSLLDRRRALWALLIGLVAALLLTLIWLAGRYEVSQVQAELEREASDAVSDIRSALSRNAQALQALQSLLDGGAVAAAATPLESPLGPAQALLREHREWLRIEWRDASLVTRAAIDTPLRTPVFDRSRRANAQGEVALACANARQQGGPAYSASHFVPARDGQGQEVMELCLAPIPGGPSTYLVVTYSLHEVLAELIKSPASRRQEVSFVEPDGTRLAALGRLRPEGRLFSAQQVLHLPGNSLVLRMDGWRGAPDLFPNVLTALVTVMSIALVLVLVLLARDTRKRLKAEHELAEALGFRKAMEDSLVTGLRARDLQGRISYVNPAFCQMVGFAATELLGRNAPLPYWPPEMVDEYQQRQDVRMAGNAPPREGFESVFMRKDGSRFPVLIIEAPLINALGRQTGWMSAFLDISEQRRVEELSRASQERLQATARLATVGEMASLLSHELNQPLAAIASYATGSLNVLKQAEKGGSDSTFSSYFEVMGAMQRIAEQAERAGKVINSVHDFVRRREQVREAVAPQVLLDAILPLVNLQARKLGVRVRLALAGKLPAVLCDRTMVEQVLLNLARNAMQAMDEPGLRQRELDLRVERVNPGSAGGPGRPGWLAFSVADRGAGISGEVATKLFTPFFTTKAEGMGLGLSLCRTVVEQHGGHLAHHPQAPRGTVFVFTLPVAEPVESES